MERRLDLQDLLPMPLGDVTSSTAARAVIAASGIEHARLVQTLMDRQQWANWGNLTADERTEMDNALIGLGLVAGRHTFAGGELIVVTYPDRKTTTILAHADLEN